MSLCAHCVRRMPFPRTRNDHLCVWCRCVTPLRETDRDIVQAFTADARAAGWTLRVVRPSCSCDAFCDDPCPAHPDPSKPDRVIRARFEKGAFAALGEGATVVRAIEGAIESLLRAERDGLLVAVRSPGGME